MAFCKKCGNKLEDDAKFCTNCGTPVAKNEKERITIYEGSIHKCPNCGEILESFYTNCPSCGYEIRDRNSSESIKEFTNKLEELEKEKAHSKTLGSKSKINGKEINLIRNYTIPNTKEDIFEFIVLAASNINENAYGGMDPTQKTTSNKSLSNAWLAKMEQAYQKALISFGNSTEFSNIQRIYDEKKKKIKHKKLSDLLPILFLCIIFVLIEVGTFKLINQPESKERDNHLKYVVSQIEEDMRNGNYNDAKNKAYTLTYDEELDNEKHEYWQKKQQEIIEEIDKAENSK